MRIRAPPGRPGASMPEQAPQLKRVLGLRDVTFFAITCIVGTRWIPAAAHAGPGSVTLRLLAALFYMSAGIYALGPSYAHLAASRPFLLAISLVAIWVALGTNLIGMKIGKWTENVGATATWLLGALLVIVAAVLFG